MSRSGREREFYRLLVEAIQRDKDVARFLNNPWI